MSGTTQGVSACQTDTEGVQLDIAEQTQMEGDCVLERDNVLLQTATLKYTGQAGNWSIEFFQGQGESKDNVTNLVWSAVATAEDVTEVDVPTNLPNKSTLVIAGRSAVFVVNRSSVTELMQALKRTLNLNSVLPNEEKQTL